MPRNPAASVLEVEEVIGAPAAASAAGRATDWGAIIGGALAAIGIRAQPRTGRLTIF